MYFPGKNYLKKKKKGVGELRRGLVLFWIFTLCIVWIYYFMFLLLMCLFILSTKGVSVLWDYIYIFSSLYLFLKVHCYTEHIIILHTACKELCQSQVQCHGNMEIWGKIRYGPSWSINMILLFLYLGNLSLNGLSSNHRRIPNWNLGMWVHCR